MDCARSVELLSDFREGELDNFNKAEVSKHLNKCVECAQVFEDLDVIVATATLLNREGALSYPDEDVLLARIFSATTKVH